MAGERDELWLEEQCTALLDAVLDAEAAPAPEAGARAARAELQRRLRVAADFIESHYTEPLTLACLAEVACLSRHHFVREFARNSAPVVSHPHRTLAPSPPPPTPH